MARKHERNTGPMLASARCCARTRSGKPCRAPAANGMRRCRLHGGAMGSGAPKGNQNALKHGYYSRAAVEERRALRKLIRDAENFLEEV